MNAPNRPGPRRATAPQEVTGVVAAKAEFRALAVELGLTLDDGSLSKRGASRYLAAYNQEHGAFKDPTSDNVESTVRGWVNAYALNRCPPEKVLAFLRRKVEERRLGGRESDVWGAQLSAALGAIR